MNFVFDFDGTISDSMPAFIAVFNKTVRHNKNPITTKEIELIRGMTIRRASKELGVKWWNVPKLVLMGMNDFHALVPSLKTFNGMKETIRELHKRGDKLFIVTSNTSESVETFLKKHKLESYFTDISTSAGLFNKSRYIRRLIKRNNLKRRHTIYIGDEVRDIKAARLATIRVASVTWGFNNEEILRRHLPTYLISEPKQLLDFKKHKLRLIKPRENS